MYVLVFISAVAEPEIGQGGFMTYTAPGGRQDVLASLLDCFPAVHLSLLSFYFSFCMYCHFKADKHL